jgi:hypothetical protein
MTKILKETVTIVPKIRERSWGGRATSGVCFTPESNAEVVRGRIVKDVPNLGVNNSS